LSNIVILGTGMAGLGAAHRLHENGITPAIYDKNNFHGGHTASFRYEPGFLFDVGPHISFTKDRRIQSLFSDSVDQEFESVQIILNNYWHGYWPQHPIQLHLHGLPQDIVAKVIDDFIQEQDSPRRQVRTYADWLLSSFGRTFAELFPMQYARKYHLTSADNMTVDWLGPRFYRPTLQELLRGAQSLKAPQNHYITHFRYPARGGFVSYLRKFLPLGTINLCHEVKQIDPSTRALYFSNGTVARYDALISSVPLPDVVRLIPGTPQDVLTAASQLACSTCVLVNLGVNREDLSSAHITYFYDDDICFTRVGFPHMLASSNAPPGTGSIQAEIYFSAKYRPLTNMPHEWIDPVIADLRRCGLLRENDRIIFKTAMIIPYANVIFDLDRAASLRIVHGYLDDLGIMYCGRYGDWGYLWTDESFKSGELAAERALSSISRRPALHHLGQAYC